jgi:hypothetical protein
MNNQPNQTTEQPIGVIQSSYTVSITFTAKPSVEFRQKLKAAGYLYDKGRWFRNQSNSSLATQATVDQLLAS